MSTSPPEVPSIRVSTLIDAPPSPQGQYVLYWMIANRRLSYNFALDRAIWWAKTLDKPLIILEPLRCGYRWASDRLHRFIMDGMAEHHKQLHGDPNIAYYPYLERAEGQGSGLLQAMSEHACVVVTDDYPAFFIPKMLRAAAKQLSTRFEKIDANGLLPLAATDRVYTTAYSFRRALHKLLPKHLAHRPQAAPLQALKLPPLNAYPLREIVKRWPAATLEQLEDQDGQLIASLPIDHSVGKVGLRGGDEAAQQQLRRFIKLGLPIYKEQRNDPDAHAASGLSPYLHFGHIGTHHIFDALIQRDQWSPEQISDKPTGQREGWWNTSPEVESFLDELITWREIGYNMAHHAPDQLESYDSLADWAKETLQDHLQDHRPYVYTLEEFEQAKTHDRIWNAAQNELVKTGKMHNYLRMLWGKKIIEWSPTPQHALDIMIELNNKYALDGRDPNSYSGIFWCFGRYDRGWTERDILGKVRYMSSDSTQRKLNLRGYLNTYAPKRAT